MPVEIIGEVGTPGADREWKELRGPCGPPVWMNLFVDLA